jgi:hypothetical protein
MHPPLNHDTLLLVFVAVTALAVVMQAFLLLAILISVRTAARAVQQELETLRKAVMPVLVTALPILEEAREVLGRIAPRLESAAADLAELAYGLRAQAAEIQSSASEWVERARIQAQRMDAMLTDALDATERAANYVANSVVRPVRKASNLLAGVRAAVESYKNSRRAR